MRPAFRNHRKFWASLLVAGLAVLLALGFRYRGHVSSAFGWISEETGGPVMALLAMVLAVCVAAYALFCFVLPFLIYFGLKDLRARTRAIEAKIGTEASEMAKR
jgi:hypothetical protein